MLGYFGTELKILTEGSLGETGPTFSLPKLGLMSFAISESNLYIDYFGVLPKSYLLIPEMFIIF